MTTKLKNARWCTECGKHVLGRPPQAKLCLECFGYRHDRYPAVLAVDCPTCGGPFGATEAYCASCKKLMAEYPYPHFRLKILARDGFLCFYCNRPLVLSNLETDHYVPKLMGGKSGMTNQVAACRPCNALKSFMHPDKLVSGYFDQNRVKDRLSGKG